MHSNIIAYSFGIPSIGFVWNRKLRFWSENIGHPERFLEVDQLDGKEAVKRLCSAMEEKAAPSPQMKDGVYQELRYFLKKHCRIKEGRNEDFSFADYLAAPALGGMENRFKNTNSAEAFDSSIARGYRFFQTDIRLTEDEKAVCVNGWNADTYRLLGLHDEITEGKDGQKPLTLERFETLLYRDRLHTMTFAQLMQKAAAVPGHENFRFILSIGKPSDAQFTLLTEQILQAIDTAGMDRSHFILRLEKKEQVTAWKALETGIELMYYQTDATKARKSYSAVCREALLYCRQEEISWLCVNEFDESMGDLFADYPEIGGAVFRYTSVGKVVRAIRCGASIVGSTYYGVDYITALTGRN
jgi:glycerophosphoryl diester phosphodiesterase